MSYVFYRGHCRVLGTMAVFDGHGFIWIKRGGKCCSLVQKCLLMSADDKWSCEGATLFELWSLERGYTCLMVL